MAKRRATEDHLALLRQLRGGGVGAGGEQAIGALGELLKERGLHGMVVKGAAGLAERFEAKGVAGELCAQVRGLMGKDAAKRDPGCEGKTAAMQALVAWEADVGELFVEAARYRQMEPTFGGSVDTAGEMRGLAALGIAATRPPGAVEMLVDLLVDEQKAARSRAAAGLGRWRGMEAMAVLRLKARVGDEDGEVMGEVLASLLQQDGRGQLDFVAGFLGHKIPGVVEGAALALGQSKVEGALEKLTAAYGAVRGSPVATTVLMAIGLVRTEEAVGWLVQRLGQAGEREGVAVLDSLRHFRGDARIVTRIRAAVEGREGLMGVFGEVFG